MEPGQGLLGRREGPLARSPAGRGRHGLLKTRDPSSPIGRWAPQTAGCASQDQGAAAACLPTGRSRTLFREAHCPPGDTGWRLRARRSVKPKTLCSPEATWRRALSAAAPPSGTTRCSSRPRSTCARDLHPPPPGLSGKMAGAEPPPPCPLPPRPGGGGDGPGQHSWARQVPGAQRPPRASLAVILPQPP